jgi:hypothetical protein
VVVVVVIIVVGLQRIGEANTSREKWVKSQVELLLDPFLRYVKSIYPEMRYWKVGALKAKGQTPSQYQLWGNKLHTDYSEPSLADLRGSDQCRSSWHSTKQSKTTSLNDLPNVSNQLILWQFNCELTSVILPTHHMQQELAPTREVDATSYAFHISSINPLPMPPSLKKRLQTAELNSMHLTNVTCSMSRHSITQNRNDYMARRGWDMSILARSRVPQRSWCWIISLSWPTFLHG